MAGEYGNRYAEWAAQRLIEADGRHADVHITPWYVFEFLYYTPTITALAPTDLPMARVFPDLEGVIWRTGWGENDLIFGLKTGAYGGRYGFDTFTQQAYPWDCVTLGCQMNHGHDHDDSNGFYIRSQGMWLAPKSVGYDVHDTDLNNTLLIDSLGQFRPPDSRDPDSFNGSDGRLVAAANTLNFNYVAADATRRYKHIEDLRAVRRYVVFVRPDYFLMVDHLEADASHEYTWISHFGKSVSVDGDWVRGDAGADQILGVRIVSPESYTTTLGHDGRPYVHVQPESPVEGVRFVNLLVPTDDDSWESRPDVTLLADTGTAVAARVQWPGKMAGLEDILVNYVDSPPHIRLVRTEQMLVSPLCRAMRQAPWRSCTSMAARF